MNSAQRHQAAALELRERKRTIDLLARAEHEELDAAWSGLASKPDVHPVRGTARAIRDMSRVLAR